MAASKRAASAGSLIALGLFCAGLPGDGPSAEAAELTFQGPNDENPSDEAIDWSNPDNWTSATVAGAGDDVTVDPDPTNRGPMVSDAREIKSLELNTGIHIRNGGSLTVTDGITVNANPGYFINNGVVTGDVDTSAYIANANEFHGDVINRSGGAVVNEGTEDGADVATWYGDILENYSDIYNVGGVWNGDVKTNDGVISSTGTWNGDIDNTNGGLELSGIVDGDLTHSGGSFTMGNLVVTGAFTNTSGFGMDNGSADTVLRAQSWSGTGMAAFDLSTSRGRSDQAIISGSYTADTALSFALVGPAERVLGDIPVITVEGDNTGTLDVSGLPEDGVISYRLARSGNDWFLTTSLSRAPEHVAAALELVGRTLAAAERVPLNREGVCGTGNWARLFGGATDSSVADVDARIDLGGAQIGYDAACLELGEGATLGLGVTAGGAFGRIDQDFGKEGQLGGNVKQGFAGLYADLAAGALRAVLQGQIGAGNAKLSDPQTGLDAATLTTIRYDVSGNARYALGLGAFDLSPEIGFSASGGQSDSDDFADVGTMSLDGDPRLDAYLGTTLSGKFALADGATTLAPSVSVALHDELLAPDTVRFTDGAGGFVDVPLEGLGTYLALGLGIDLAYLPVNSEVTVDAGVHADFKLGDNVTESSLSGYAKVRF